MGPVACWGGGMGGEDEECDTPRQHSRARDSCGWWLSMAGGLSGVRLPCVRVRWRIWELTGLGLLEAVVVVALGGTARWLVGRYVCGGVGLWIGGVRNCARCRERHPAAE